MFTIQRSVPGAPWVGPTLSSLVIGLMGLMGLTALSPSPIAGQAADPNRVVVEGPEAQAQAQTPTVTPLKLRRFPSELIWGRPVEIEGFGEGSLKGELVAVSLDSLWIQTGGSIVSHELASVGSVRVKRHNTGIAKTMVWTGLGALATGLGMSWACNQVSDDCQGVGLSMALAWGLIGGLSAISITGSQYERLPAHADVLRPYARYPQGLKPADPPGNR